MGDESYTPYVFSESEIGRLCLAADNLGFGNHDFSVILRILYACGLRLNEALRLQISDVDLSSNVLLIHNAKGNKDRLVPVDSSLADILERYIARYHHESANDSLLFSNRKGERHSGTVVRYWFNKALESAGIEKPELPRYTRNICLHCLRHTFAVSSFRKQDLAGVDMYAAAPFLSVYMGHAKIHGTETYLHMTAETGADVIEKTTTYTEGLFPEVPR
jgi:integrase